MALALYITVAVGRFEILRADVKRMVIEYENKRKFLARPVAKTGVAGLRGFGRNERLTRRLGG
jgi:hypothetical protein